MNILFVADISIQDVIGGAERVLFEQTTRLAARGHDIHILTRRLPSHQSDSDVIQNVREWRYRVNHNNAVSFFASTFRNGKRLFETLSKANNFDCINFHQPFSAISVVHSPLSKKIKKVYTCHSLSFEEYISRNARPDNFIGRSLYFLNIFGRKWLEKKVLKRSDEIIVLSRFTLDNLCRAYKVLKQKVLIIPGGVDLKRFQPSGDKVAIRRRLNILPQKILLFTVRNLVPRMGLENLILALQRVVNNAPDIFLVIGGEGPLKDDLMALAKRLGVENHVRFTGFIPEDELPDYYRMADLFILPTRELEGFGLVTLEAMACGVPVLGTPVGGTQEILGKFDHSFLFKDITADSMADLIADNYRIIKDNPGKWSEISLRCRGFVKEHYSWDRNIDALETLFSEKPG